MLPLEVLEKAASELVCYGESGMSVMEMSHRSPDYEAIINDAEAMLRKLMNIPDNYKVLFSGRRLDSICGSSAEFDRKNRQGGLCSVRSVLRQGL